MENTRRVGKIGPAVIMEYHLQGDHMGFKFNNEINLGHIFSLVFLSGAMLTCWMVMADRVTRVEMKTIEIQTKQAALEDNMLRSRAELMTFLENMKRDVREDIKEIRSNKAVH